MDNEKRYNSMPDAVGAVKKGRKKQLQPLQIFHIFSQLHVLMSAGITPYAALRIMQEDSENKEIAAVLRIMGDKITAGSGLAEAVRAAEVFPAYAEELLYAGEQTGRTDEACEALAHYYEDEDALRESIKSAVSYPLMMIVVMFLVILVLIHQVMPVFAQIFRQLGASTNGIMELLLRSGRFFSRFYVVAAVILGLLIVLFLYGYFTEDGRKRFGQFARRFPLTARLSEELALVRFTGVLQMAQGAGLDPYRSLEMAAGVLDHEELREKISRCRQKLSEGESFSQAMADAAIYSPFYTSMLSVFSEAGRMDRALEFIRSHYKEDTDRRIARILSLIEPSMVIGLSLIVGVILLSVILPLIGIMSGLG